MAYDIFISYRRRGGFETAKHLYDLLTKDGYRVSFDIDTLRNGDFDTELLRRIDECRDFILILSEGALDRCVDPSAVASADWVRCELAYALEKNKNIVPIMLAGFTAFPDNLPDDIRKVVRKNGPKYDSYYFDDFYRRLKSDFLETKPEERGDEDAYVTQLLKRLSALKSVPEPTDGQQAELGETYYELGRLASLHNRPDMLDYLPQALAIFRRLAEKEPERYRARIAELEPLVRRNRRTFRLFTGLFLLFTIAFCVLLPAGLLYWIVRAGAAHNYPLMAAGVAVLGGVFALFVYLAGGLYDFSDAELAEQFREGRRRVERFNRTPADDAAAYAAALGALIPGIPASAKVVQPFYCDLGWRIELGEEVFVNMGCTFLDCGGVRIGARTKLGPNCQLYTPQHPVDYLDRRRPVETSFRITIGEDCWLGGGVVVCPGVTIGDRSVVAAGSVVVRDIPADSLAAGNPATVKRRLR